jgi:transposase
VRVISRDWGGEYAEGAKRAAPWAVQVADRFHLLKNLSEVVERVFRRHSLVLARIPPPGSLPGLLVPPRPDHQAARQRTRDRAQERSQQVHWLAQQGMSKSTIARVTGMYRQTIGGYLRSDTVPERSRRRDRGSILAPYQGYIRERCRQEYWNAMGLWREVVALGFTGTYKIVNRLVTYLRKLAEEEIAATAPMEELTPRKTVGLLLRHPEKEREGQQATIKALLGPHPEIARAVVLLEGFIGMVRGQSWENLEGWMEDARGSSIAELRGFVTKLGQDLAAVCAGLKLNRRQMYGRGKFDLLRKRVLRAA